MPIEADPGGTSIADRLGRLNQLATSGFALPLHFRYQTPTYLFQTYPAAWTEVYSRAGLMLRDPVVRWGLANVGVTTWAELERDDPGGVMALARTYGLVHGVVISWTATAAGRWPASRGTTVP